MDETEHGERSSKGAAAQLSSSITRISTLPKRGVKTMDSAEPSLNPCKPREVEG